MPASLLVLALVAAAACSAGDGDSTETPAAATATGTGGGPDTGSGGSPEAPALDPTSAAGLTSVPSPQNTPRKPVPPENSGKTSLAIDAVPATSLVDAAATQSIGAAFDVVVVLTAAGAPFVGFQLDLGFDPANIAFEAFANAAAASFPACSPARTYPDAVAVACLRSDVTDTDYAGMLGRFTLRCVAAGTTVLRLREPAPGTIGTRIESRPSSRFLHVLSTANATITCI